jgi:hypothetical protein
VDDTREIVAALHAAFRRSRRRAARISATPPPTARPR